MRNILKNVWLIALLIVSLPTVSQTPWSGFSVVEKRNDFNSEIEYSVEPPVYLEGRKGNSKAFIKAVVLEFEGLPYVAGVSVKPYLPPGSCLEDCRFSMILEDDSIVTTYSLPLDEPCSRIAAFPLTTKQKLLLLRGGNVKGFVFTNKTTGKKLITPVSGKEAYYFRNILHQVLTLRKKIREKYKS